MKRLAFTLVEIIVAMTVLAVGSILVFKMFQYAIVYSGRLGDEAIAVVMAEKRVEEIRGWAYSKSSGAYNFIRGNWLTLNGTITSSDYSSFTVTTAVAPATLRSPASSLSTGKALISSAMYVKVTVSWDTGAGIRRFTLITILGEPARQCATISVQPGMPTPITLGANAQVGFTATAYDTIGDSIPDLTFRWSVDPVTASGTVWGIGEFATQSIFKNCVTYADGSTRPSEGTCRVNAYTRFWGVPHNRRSTDMTLTDP